MFIIHLHIKFHMSSSNGLLIHVIQWKTVDIARPPYSCFTYSTTKFPSFIFLEYISSCQNYGFYVKWVQCRFHFTSSHGCHVGRINDGITFKWYNVHSDTSEKKQILLRGTHTNMMIPHACLPLQIKRANSWTIKMFQFTHNYAPIALSQESDTRKTRVTAWYSSLSFWGLNKGVVRTKRWGECLYLTEMK
jgi:hypothetical protein